MWITPPTYDFVIPSVIVLCFNSRRNNEVISQPYVASRHRGPWCHFHYQRFILVHDPSASVFGIRIVSPIGTEFKVEVPNHPRNYHPHFRQAKSVTCSRQCMCLHTASKIPETPTFVQCSCEDPPRRAGKLPSGPGKSASQHLGATAPVKRREVPRNSRRTCWLRASACRLQSAE